MKNLRILRAKKGISQQKLADQLGLSQQTIYKYENKIAEPDIATLQKMADFFNTSVDYLIGYTDIDHKIEKVTAYSLNDEELNFIENFRRLPRDTRVLYEKLVEKNLKH